jgi:hypothetical protein
MLVLLGCNVYDCRDEITPIFNKISYRNNAIVTFINDSGVINADTVLINYSKVPATYKDDGSEFNGQANCTGNFSVVLGNYKIYGFQSGYSNPTLTISFTKPIITPRKKSETVAYNYNGVAINSIHIYSIDTIKSDIFVKEEKILKEYYYSISDYQLLFYSITENNMTTNWRIK